MFKNTDFLLANFNFIQVSLNDELCLLYRPFCEFHEFGRKRINKEILIDGNDISYVYIGPLTVK